MPSWLITDRTYRDRYLFAGRAPRTPLPRRWFDAGVAHRADTVAGLAASIGVPPEELGLVLAAGTAIRLVSAPLAGRIGDVLGALRLVLVTCTAAAAAPIVPTVPVVCQ